MGLVISYCDIVITLNNGLTVNGYMEGVFINVYKKVRNIMINKNNLEIKFI